MEALDLLSASITLGNNAASSMEALDLLSASTTLGKRNRAAFTRPPPASSPKPIKKFVPTEFWDDDVKKLSQKLWIPTESSMFEGTWDTSGTEAKCLESWFTATVMMANVRPCEMTFDLEKLDECLKDSKGGPEQLGLVPRKATKSGKEPAGRVHKYRLYPNAKQKVCFSMM